MIYIIFLILYKIKTFIYVYFFTIFSQILNSIYYIINKKYYLDLSKIDKTSGYYQLNKLVFTIYKTYHIRFLSKRSTSIVINLP